MMISGSVSHFLNGRNAVSICECSARCAPLRVVPQVGSPNDHFPLCRMLKTLA